MIVGFACPVCHRNQPRDHYETSKCGLTISPDYATAILRDNEDRYIKDQVTVTAGLGCPRSRAIEADVDVYVNPLAYNALLIGRAWDLHMEKYAPEGTAKITLKGTIEGITVYGEIDRVRRCDGWLMISDWKHTNNFQQKWIKQEGVKRENVIQTSIYAELYAQQFGERPTHGEIIYHFSGASSSSNPSLMPFQYLLLPLDECLAHKPYNGQFTVLDLYRQADRYEKWKRGEGGIKVEALDLPLAGVSMSFGAKEFCSYCQVESTCKEAATGSPF